MCAHRCRCLLQYINTTQFTVPYYRYANQKGTHPGSADVFAPHQDRTHPPERVLWLYVLHHVD